MGVWYPSHAAAKQRRNGHNWDMAQRDGEALIRETKRRLRRGVFRSIVDLQAAIHRYIAEHNTEPKPFVWTADPDRVLAAINRGKQALGAID